MIQLPTHKREAAMVFQGSALWPHMSVGKNIAFGLEQRKVPNPEIRDRVEGVEFCEMLAGRGTSWRVTRSDRC